MGIFSRIKGYSWEMYSVKWLSMGNVSVKWLSMGNVSVKWLSVGNPSNYNGYSWEKSFCRNVKARPWDNFLICKSILRKPVSNGHYMKRTPIHQTGARLNSNLLDTVFTRYKRKKSPDSNE